MAMKLKAGVVLFFFIAMTQIEDSEESSRSVLPCLERILPCQYYMHNPNPPATCCLHLKDMISYSPTCICSVFTNENIMHALNTTRPQAANLTARCGLKTNFELCNDSSTGSITTIGENFISANAFVLVSISLFIAIGIL